LKNLQSDIIGILDNNLELVVTYEYDEWGSIISITDANGNQITDENHIANINPFRYRGYYYDQETKLYYLNSRYYNPEWRRFINADGIIGANKDHVGYNLYTYVSNNPINNMDYDGKWILTLIKAVIITYVAVKALIIITSDIYLTTTNNDISKDLYQKSLTNPKTPMSNDTQNSIATKASNSNEVKNIVQKCIENSNQEKFNGCSSSDLNFKVGDLHYSIGKANITISGQKLANDSWNIYATLSDTYNFDGIRKPWLNFSNIANNLGYFTEKTWMSRPYYWEVTFGFNYKEE